MAIVRFVNITPVELIDRVLWSFGDNSTSTLMSPDHYYPSGDFSASLTAWLTTAQQETKVKTVIVPGNISASFSFVQNSPVQVSFTDQSDYGTIIWDWDFGDGSPHSSARDPVHVYATPNTYTAVLTTNGRFISTRFIELLPVADYSYTVVNSTTVSFVDTSTKFPTSWLWNFGDGTTSTVQSPTHVYGAPGTYSVVLTVNGGSTITKSVNTLPVANYSYAVVDPTTVSFVDTSTKFPTSWLWDFGDGTTSTVQSPTHVYGAPGTYSVILTVNGGSTITRPINTQAAPSVTFTRPDYSPGTTDTITGSMIMARGNSGGIFNTVTEAFYIRSSSPGDTEWSEVQMTPVGDPTSLSYAVWVAAVYGFPPGMVGNVIYMHIISEDKYYEMHFTSWTAGGGGGFSYTRYDVTP